MAAPGGRVPPSDGVVVRQEPGRPPLRPGRIVARNAAGVVGDPERVLRPDAAKPPKNSPAKAAVFSVPSTYRASLVESVGRKLYLGADGAFEGHRLDRFDFTQAPLRPITLASSRGGAVWKVYRDATRKPFAYRVERIVGMVSSPVRHTPPMGQIQTSRLIARWLGLIIDGPPPGDEPGNVPIGVAHDPDGSTWTVYRARQSAPYTYSVEHSTTARAKEPTKRLDDASGEITRELRRRALLESLPASLSVGGEAWRIAPLPQSIGGTPTSLVWTEAALRRALHLGAGESLDFKPVANRSGVEIAKLIGHDADGTENVLNRRREKNGTTTYWVHTVVRRDQPGTRP